MIDSRDILNTIKNNLIIKRGQVGSRMNGVGARTDELASQLASPTQIAAQIALQLAPTESYETLLELQPSQPQPLLQLPQENDLMEMKSLILHETKNVASFVVIGETLDKLYYKDKLVKTQKEFLDWTKLNLGFSKSTTYEYIISYRVSCYALNIQVFSRANPLGSTPTNSRFIRTL